MRAPESLFPSDYTEFPSDYTEGYPLRKDFPLQGKGWRDTFEFLNEKA